MKKLPHMVAFVAGLIFGLIVSQEKVLPSKEFIVRYDTIRDTVRVKSPQLIPEIVKVYKSSGVRSKAVKLPDSLPELEYPDLDVRVYKTTHEFPNGLHVSAESLVSGQLLYQNLSYYNLPVVTKTITKKETTRGFYVGATVNFTSLFLNASFQHNRNQFEIGYDVTGITMSKSLPLQIGYKRKLF